MDGTWQLIRYRGQGGKKERGRSDSQVSNSGSTFTVIRNDEEVNLAKKELNGLQFQILYIL